mmetsp:Transcript_27895/g.38579  ORF Transcript_27895/g.38579 Transcript_27895/m.38579 type:complete len:82 (-) Transcript_27895:133-378(-)
MMHENEKCKRECNRLSQAIRRTSDGSRKSELVGQRRILRRSNEKKTDTKPSGEFKSSLQEGKTQQSQCTRLKGRKRWEDGL